MTPLKRLVQLIEENKISAVPIVDEQGVPVGIVSESDLLTKEGALADAIMTRPPITVRADASIAQAARVMRERNVRRLVVVDERGKIVGIVSRSDFFPKSLGSIGPRTKLLSGTG
jgi:CBS domain-containing protein